MCSLQKTATNCIFNLIWTEGAHQGVFSFAEQGQAVLIGSFSNTQKYAVYLTSLQNLIPVVGLHHVCPNIHFCAYYRTQLINVFAIPARIMFSQRGQQHKTEQEPTVCPQEQIKHLHKAPCLLLCLFLSATPGLQIWFICL